MKLRLLKPHDYDNKRLNAGDEIDDVPDEMGTYLVTLKVAEEVKESDGNTMADDEKVNSKEKVLFVNEPEKVEMNPVKNEKKKGRPKSKK